MGVVHAAQASLDDFPPMRRARYFSRFQRKIASSDIEVAHRDVLIRLRSIIEEDLEVEGERRRLSHTRAPSAWDHNEGRDQ